MVNHYLGPSGPLNTLVFIFGDTRLSTIIIGRPKLKFDCHITNIDNKLNKILGFIRCNCADFDDSLAFKSVYYCLVRSICEYSSIIWSPYQSGHKHKIEEIQHKFLRFLSFKCSIFRELHSLSSLFLTFLNIETLEQRRMRLDLYFSYKLFTELIDCPEFLSCFSFYAPSCNSRSKNIFYLTQK
jgi:hypothetical protein